MKNTNNGNTTRHIQNRNESAESADANNEASRHETATQRIRQQQVVVALVKLTCHPVLNGNYASPIH
jgi:hypothetical protein